MNIFMPIFVFLFFQLSLFAQTENVQHIKIKKENSDSVYAFVEEDAHPVDESSGFFSFLIQNLVYPKRAIDEGITGKVYIRAIIEKDGSVSNVSVIKGIENCPECDAEAVRVISQMPKWIPAKNANKVVRARIQIPINFSLAR